MKITPSKDYKKPLYAIGIAAALTALSITGCTDPGKVDYAGDVVMGTVETSEVRLDGEVANTDPTEVDFEGEVAEPEPTKPTVNSVITAGIVPNTIDRND